MNNWFEKHAEVERIALALAMYDGLEKDAGARESMVSAILAAIMAIISGIPAESAAEQLKNNPKATQTVESMMSSPVVRERIQNIGPKALPAAESLSKQLKNHQGTESALRHPSTFSLEEQINIIARTIWTMARDRKDINERDIATKIWKENGGNVEAMISAFMNPKKYQCWRAMTPEDWNNFKIKQRSGEEWETSVNLAKDITDGSFEPIVSKKDFAPVSGASKIPKPEYLEELKRSLKQQGKFRNLSETEITNMLEKQYSLIHQKESNPDEKNVIKSKATNLNVLRERYEKQPSLVNDMPIIEQVAREQNLNDIQKKMLISIRVIENGRRGCEFGVADYDLASPARRYAPERVGIDKSKPGWEKEWDAKYRDLSLKVQAEYAAGTIKKRLQFDENGDPMLARMAFRWCPENWENWTDLIKKFMMS